MSAYPTGTVGLCPQEIVSLIAGYYGFDFHTLTGDARAMRITIARRAAVWAIRKFTRTRPKDIADMFGKDRKIIYNAWNEFEQSPDPNVRREAEEIAGLINAEVRRMYDDEIPF